MKHTTIAFSCTKEVKETINEIIKKENITMSDFLRSIVIKEINEKYGIIKI